MNLVLKEKSEDPSSDDIPSKKSLKSGISVTKLQSTECYDHLINKVSSNGVKNNVLPTAVQIENKKALEKEMEKGVRTPKWLADADDKALKVIVNPIAEDQLRKFAKDAMEDQFR